MSRPVTPSTCSVWRWRSADDLQVGKADAHREPLYRSLLAGRFALDTLRQVKAERPAAVPEPRNGRVRRPTATARFGSSRRESHDASAFYDRFVAPELSNDTTVVRPKSLNLIYSHDARDMSKVESNSVAKSVWNRSVGETRACTRTGERVLGLAWV